MGITLCTRLGCNSVVCHCSHSHKGTLCAANFISIASKAVRLLYKIKGTLLLPYVCFLVSTHVHSWQEAKIGTSCCCSKSRQRETTRKWPQTAFVGSSPFPKTTKVLGSKWLVIFTDIKPT